MGFFDSLKNGFEITVASLKVTAEDPEFLILPILTGIIMLAILATFFISIGNSLSDVGFWGFLVVYYLVSFTLLYFIQAMVIEGARQKFSGKNPSLGEAFSVAWSKIGKIVVLAVIASVVSIIARILESQGQKRGGLGGLGLQLFGALLGAAWAVISYFSLPIILYEDAGVFESFSKSGSLFKKTWGETVASNLSLLLVYVPAVVFVILAFFVGGDLAFAFLILGLICLFLGAIVSTVAKAVVSEALYMYAKDGKVPSAFPQEAIEGAFSSK
jgi:hypothetical protein